jgi:hypothetical protein
MEDTNSVTWVSKLNDIIQKINNKEGEKTPPQESTDGKGTGTT